MRRLRPNNLENSGPSQDNHPCTETRLVCLDEMAKDFQGYSGDRLRRSLEADLRAGPARTATWTQSGIGSQWVLPASPFPQHQRSAGDDRLQRGHGHERHLAEHKLRRREVPRLRLTPSTLRFQRRRAPGNLSHPDASAAGRSPAPSPARHRLLALVAVGTATTDDAVSPVDCVTVRWTTADLLSSC